MNTSTHYIIQTNMDIDKYGAFDAQFWYDVPNCTPQNTLVNAQALIKQPLMLHRTSPNHPWHYTLAPEQKRIIKRTITESVIESAA